MATNLTKEVLFDRIFKKFDNFDYVKFIQAMSSVENKKFIC